MKTAFLCFAFAIFIAAFADCAQPERTASTPRVFAVGSRFEGTGKAVLHRGQPCTSQIMFDFHPAKSKSVVWLAVNAHEERQLIEAANKHRTIHIAGRWQRGKMRDCQYVSLTSLEVQKPKYFWEF